jgi:hypothetical protein
MAGRRVLAALLSHDRRRSQRRLLPALNINSKTAPSCAFVNKQYALDGGHTLGLGGRNFRNNDVDSAVNFVARQ